jgi:hypothetical protein
VRHWAAVDLFGHTEGWGPVGVLYGVVMRYRDLSHQPYVVVASLDEADFAALRLAGVQAAWLLDGGAPVRAGERVSPGRRMALVDEAIRRL